MKQGQGCGNGVREGDNVLFGTGSVAFLESALRFQRKPKSIYF